MKIKVWQFITDYGKKSWLATAIFSLGFSNLLLPLDSFERAKNLVLLGPNNSFAHLELSEAAAQALDWDLAQTELRRAYLLLNRNKGSMVFGITSRFEAVQGRVYQEQAILEEIRALLNILESHPGYRDVYLRISLLYYQLFDDAAASSFWNAARELDPNSSEVLRLGKFLK